MKPISVGRINLQIVFITYNFAVNDVEQCKCDKRGTDSYSGFGYSYLEKRRMGCGLQKIPCKLLTGRVTTGSYRDNKREYCKTSDGENQINCPGNKNFDERNGTLNFRLFII